MEVQQAHWERTVASGQGPAYRIHTQRLVLRCWQPTDAPLLKAAIDASLEHLRPWLPWAQHEPKTSTGRSSICAAAAASLI